MTSAQQRAETYLRLRVEAELRRVQALPRPEPAPYGHLPAPLRGATRLAGPLGRNAATVLTPLAASAARTLRPLAESAEQAMRPLTDSVLTSLQPLADSAARWMQPLAGQVIGVVLPAADEAARRLHPLAWQAAGRLQAMQQSGADRVTQWRGQASRATATLRGAQAGAEPDRQEDLTAEEGLRRLAVVADGLARAGAIDPGTADSIVADLETALAARGRIEPYRLGMRQMQRLHQRRAAGPPAGPYVAVPAGALVPVGPESGLTEVRLFTLVLAPDRAVLTVVGRLSDENLRSEHLDPWPLFGDHRPAARDDRGNRYELREDSGWSDQENWGGVLRLNPVPPAGTQWLDLIISPQAPTVRLDLTGPGPDHDGPKPEGPGPAVSLAERLVDAAALELLALAAGGGHSLPRHDLSAVADVVTALGAVGALEPAQAAVGRLVTLAGRLGVAIPSALSAASPPGPAELPEAWRNVLENTGRLDGPRAAAPVSAVLPELDGVRFVLTGLRSVEAGADLYVMAWGARVMPHFLHDSAFRLWSWSARDDRGRWHVAEEGNSSSSDQHADLTLRLVPPLHPESAALTVTVAGPSGEVTATVPLDWGSR